MLSTDNTSTAQGGFSFDAWHHFTCQNFSISECRREPNQDFRARVASRRFGALVLSDVSSSASNGIHMRRGPAEIRQDPRDHFMFCLVKAGRIDLAQDGRRASAQAGDLLLYDQTMPFTLDFYCHQALLVSIPRLLLSSRVSEARLFTARCVTAKSKLASMTGAVIREIVGFEEVPVADISNRLVGLALDIIATTLEAECAGQIDMQVASHRLLPQVEQYILSNLGDSTLDVDTIARAQNIAPRTLNRIFAAKGMTPIRWLWQQRLVASFKALLEGEVISVTDAAFRFGFTDLSHFSRAFKREFGQLPHEVQRALPSHGCRQR